MPVHSEENTTIPGVRLRRLLPLLFSQERFIGQCLELCDRSHLLKLGVFMNENGICGNRRGDTPAVAYRETICGLYLYRHFENRISDVYSFQRKEIKII